MNQLLVMAALAAGTTVQQPAPPPRDPDTDGPALEANALEPLPNFAQVSTAVFRSGQPDPATAGIVLAHDKGIKTILNLRLRWHEDERDTAKAAGIKVKQVRMNGIYSPTFSQVDRALEIMTDPELQPVLVHCHYGKDRTGVVLAAYRVAIQGWSIIEADEEAHKFGCCQPLFVDLHEYLVDYMDHRAQQSH